MTVLPLCLPELMIGDAVAAAVAHPALRELFGYWDSKKREGRLPRLGDFDPPAEIPRITCNMSIVLVEPGTGRCKCKRMGSAIVANRRHRRVRDATGHYLDEIDFNTSAEHVLGALAEVLRIAQPYRELNRFRAGEYASMWYEWLILPMSDDGAAVTSMLTGDVVQAKRPAPH